MTTTIVDGVFNFELLDPSEPFKVRFGLLPHCVDPDCDGQMMGDIHGEFWLKRILYRQWMDCTCSQCEHREKELIEVYDEVHQRYVLQNQITIYDDRLKGTHRLPGFGQSIAPLIQAAQEDGVDPAGVMQDVVNALMHRSRRQYLEA